MSKSILVTTGATVTFNKLIQYTLDPEFIQLVNHKLGYHKVVIQYGNSNEAESLVSTLKQKLLESSSSSGLDLQLIKYDSQLVENYTSKSDLVISHAGTGSILDTLRCHKKLLVLINDDLKDNHQLEIASAFEQLDVLRYVKGEFDNFLQLVEEIDGTDLKQLEEPKGSIMENIIFGEVTI
ncbi:glycosyltransferase family 1 protein [[Candida] arabinofermentans NRRL YB-2248]|uniref:UDP-N-acetylglucosamine transferase subunit ALG13 n=1 Tax=[Candida] arabinofermentans NRRL YB-2248 TaxID=983967 RepID=A0A1E4T7E5_9ASCO|nr:glycosyltransferase family 1 protein [[Candida] arabinofermentans NRRL YB-2248]